MIVTSSSAPYNVPTTSAASTANQYGTWYCARQQHEEAGADQAHAADREVDDSGGPVDEHDAERQHPVHQTRDESVGDELAGEERGGHRVSRPRGPGTRPAPGRRVLRAPAADPSKRTRPFSRNTARSAIESATLSDCSTMTMVRPSRFSCSTTARSCSTTIGDKPSESSSMSKHVGVVQQRDRERQHLLLAAGQRDRHLVLAVGEHAEHVEHARDPPVAIGADRRGRCTRPSRGSRGSSCTGTRPCRRAGGGCRASRAARARRR